MRRRAEGRSTGEALYGLALRLYPARLRRERGAEMRALYRELEREAARGGARARRGFRRRILLDLVRSLPTEHVRALRSGPPRSRSWARGRASLIGSLLQDVGHAARSFARAPGFTVAAVATIAIGIGATTAMFAVVDGVLLRPLPYPTAGALVQIGLRYDDVEVAATSASDYYDLSDRARSLVSVAVSRLQWLDLAGGGEPERLDAAGVSSTFFDVLGVAPALGRAFAPADDHRGAEAIVVLSDGFWRRRFGGDPGVIGRVLTLNGEPWTVAGVMPAGFRGPAAIYQQDTDLWFPLGRIADRLDQRGESFLQMIARLRPGQDVVSTRTELRAIGEQVGEEHSEGGVRTYWVADLRERTIGDAGLQLWILLGAVALLLVIACVNVANLFLVRATERMRELALRAALGAGRGRIARQLLTESALLGLAGGAAGALLAWGGVVLFRSFAPAEVPRLAELAFDVRVLLFACAVSLATGIGFGLVPALRLSRGDVADRLRDGGRGSTGAVAGHRLRAVFVAGQMAMALVLLTGAALLVNGFARLASVDPGFDTRGVAWLNVDLPPRRYPEAAARAAVFERALERVRALPGVRAAGAIHGLPLDGNRSLASVLPEGHDAADGERPHVPFHSVLPGYFGALGIPLIAGRDIAQTDRGGPAVAVVSAALARRFWPGESALGRRIRIGDDAAPLVTIVGVAGDTRHYGLAEEPEPIVYLHYARVPRNWLAIAVRHDGPAGPLLDAMRRAVWSIDPDLPLDRFGTLRDVAAASLVEPRFRTALLSFYAVIALALTFVGLYGTMTHLVRARRRELGIRLALGAATRDVYRLVLGNGLRIAAAGIAAGLVAAYLATRVLASFLFGIGTSDPATYAAGGAFLAAIALLACWIPARRAAGLDPVRTLRAD